jgi:hypothetical protein
VRVVELQTGVAPVHVDESMQLAHEWVVVSHVGVAPLQSPLVRHPTHAFDWRLHFGVAPRQFASDAHSTQLPALGPDVRHAAGLGQSLLLTHGWQVWVAALQVGWSEFGQSLPERQATH